MLLSDNLLFDQQIHIGVVILTTERFIQFNNEDHNEINIGLDIDLNSESNSDSFDYTSPSHANLTNYL